MEWIILPIQIVMFYWIFLGVKTILENQKIISKQIDELKAARKL